MLKIALRVHFEAYAEPVSALVGCNLVVDLCLTAQACVGAPQDLKGSPAESNRFESRLHRAVPNVLAPKRLIALRREQKGFGFLIGQTRAPEFKISECAHS